MSGRITLYDNTGTPLVEVAGRAPRDWKLNMYGGTKIRLPASEFKSADYPSGQLHYPEAKVGNLVLIEHDRVPPWVGMLALPQTFDEVSGEVELTAYSAEWVLLYRLPPIGPKRLEGTRGQLFIQYIQWANDIPGPRFKTGYVDQSGLPIAMKRAKVTSIYDSILYRLAGERAGNDWGITPDFDDAGRLFFRCHWFSARGVARPNFALVEGHNLQIPTGAALTLEGEIANVVRVIGEEDREDPDAGKPKDEKRDDDSISEYGYFYKGKSVEATDQSEVGDVAQTILNEQAQPRKRFMVQALDVNDSFDFIQLGDRIPLRLYRAGWIGDMLGYDTDIRVLGMHFDEFEGYMTLVVEESVL